MRMVLPMVAVSHDQPIGFHVPGNLLESKLLIEITRCLDILDGKAHG